MDEILHQLIGSLSSVYPIIYWILYIPGGAGFLPLTVSLHRLSTCLVRWVTTPFNLSSTTGEKLRFWIDNLLVSGRDFHGESIVDMVNLLSVYTVYVSTRAVEISQPRQ